MKGRHLIVVSTLVAFTAIFIKSDTLNPKKSERIVGGKPIIPYSYPSYLTTWKRYQYDPTHGALIHPNWILSCRYCLYPTLTWNVTAAEYIDSEDEGPEQIRQIRHTQKYYPEINSSMVIGFRGDTIDVTPMASSGGYYIDGISMASWDPPFDLNDKVKTVLVATDRHPLPNAATIVAHGIVDGHGTWNRTVREASLPLVTLERCREIWAKRPKPVDITDKSLCAGTEDGLVNGCLGDFGAPLYDLTNGVQVLIGLMSLFGCNNEPNRTYVTIFIRVSKYIRVIERLSGLCFEEKDNSGVGMFVDYSDEVRKTEGYELEIFSDLVDSVCSQYEEYMATGSIPPPNKSDFTAKIGWSWFRKSNCCKSGFTSHICQIYIKASLLRTQLFLKCRDTV